MQCDIKKFFPSIDHTILKVTLRRKIKCPNTLWLIDTIIDSSNPQEPVNLHFPGDDLLTPIKRRKGLPIGNLTSQFFGNLYLGQFDHFVKETLKVKRYLRYVDDFCAFADDREFLVEIRPRIEAYLAGLRLQLHPIKNQIFATAKGANFVGFRVLPDRIRVRPQTLRRSRRRFKELQRQYAEGQLSIFQLIAYMQGWECHLKHGDTYRLRQQIFSQVNFSLVDDVNSF